MSVAFYSILAVTTFLATTLAYFLILGHLTSLASTKTFAAVIAPKIAFQPMMTEQRTTSRLLDSIHWLRAILKVTDDPALQWQFDCAALPASIARDIFFAARFGGPVFVLTAGYFSPFARGLCMFGGAGIAYLAPAIVLGRLVKRHRDRVRFAIPDAVDLLVICVDAGLGLDQALVRVGDELRGSHPAIHHEFAQINREQKAGKLRLEAWKAMSQRMALAETDALVNMLTQTERFGTPVARALSSFGDTIRQRRRQKAEELAAKTTIKIIFPLVFFIFPCIFIVLLGPAAITIFRSMGAAHK